EGSERGRHRAEPALTKLRAERPRDVVLVAPVVDALREARVAGGCSKVRVWLSRTGLCRALEVGAQIGSPHPGKPSLEDAPYARRQARAIPGVTESLPRFGLGRIGVNGLGDGPDR